MDSLRTAYAKYILSKNIKHQDPGNGFFKGLNPVDAGFTGTYPPQGDIKKDVPIGIVGAGVAGLAVALCLSKAGYTNVEILEAHPKRVGGRCYTFSFKTGPACKHDYYDVGAMRIPDVPTMQSTFTWIKDLNAQLEKLKKPQIVLSDYVYNAHCEPSMYFYSSKEEAPTKFEYFMINPLTGILTKNGFLDPVTQQPSGDFDTAFTTYINSADQPDKYSTRAFLMHKADPNWSYQDTEMAETFNTSTGLFDQAFMETICDYYDFQVAKNLPWYRVEGGMSNFTDAMHNVAINLGTKITLDAPVSSMSISDSGSKVKVNYGSRSATYDALFNTTTLGALQRMDLSGLGLTKENLMAIRALSYDRATKVAIKFSRPWWISIMPQPSKDLAPYRYGGVSSSDLSISNVVYPSWNDGENEPHTIIVSYTWAQDATRLASLIDRHNVESTNVNDILVRTIFEQLQLLWSSVPAAADVVTPASLTKMYIAHHAFSWSHDPQATGGFALFGPGQFSTLYSGLTAPLLNNKFVVCGEAISVHHAWISGALDSAYIAVWAWLEGQGDTEGQEALKASEIGGGAGKQPAELDPHLMRWKVALTQKMEQSDE